MTRILDRIPSVLARIMDVQGGRVSIDELRDVEGVSLVYDIGQLYKAAGLFYQVRTFDTGDVAASSDTVLTIGALPLNFSILGLNVLTDTSARVSQISVFLDDIGGPGTGTESHLLWQWVAGQASHVTPTGFQAGGFTVATLDEILEVSAVAFGRQAWAKVPVVNALATQRTGVGDIKVNVLATAFGAGTVRVAGNIVMVLSLGLGGREVEYGPPAFGY